MYNFSLKGSTCFEVKTYKYVCAGRTMSTFELLMFEEKEIGTQGEILSTGEKFSPAKIYEGIEVAVQEMIQIIEEKIKDDEWVKKTEKYS